MTAIEPKLEERRNHAVKLDDNLEFGQEGGEVVNHEKLREGRHKLREGRRLWREDLHDISSRERYEIHCEFMPLQEDRVYRPLDQYKRAL